MGRAYVFVRLFALVLVFHPLEAKVRLVNNGYEDLEIVIRDTVKDDPALIDRIKDVFTDASALLFRATKQRAYFRNITIVVPKKWARDASYDPVPAVIPSNEHIRVERSRPLTADTPWTRGNVECGKPGWFFQVTPEFIKTVGRTKYGRHSNAIIHEWAHLCWGVFDEYASIMPLSTKPSDTIQFYNTGGEWKPVVCSPDIEGRALTSCMPGEGDICDLKDLKLSENCTFCPDRTQQQNIRSSLMSHQWISTMDSFCDKDSNTTREEFRHNSRAPNQQNRMCNSHSVWEVLREHEDFTGPNNPPADADIDTTPQFHVVQETGRVRVLVLDISEMMKHRVNIQRQAVIMAMSTLVEEGSSLGIVTYGRNNMIIAPITEVRNRNVLKRLRMNVPTSAGDFGNIKAGLELAVKSLEDSGMPTNGAEIVLLNGGWSFTRYTSMIPVLKAKGIMVHTIAVGNMADASLERLARNTGGRSFSYKDNDAVSLTDVYGEAVLAGNIYHDRTETVFSATVEITGKTSGKLPFYLDDGIGKETIVTAYLDATVIAGLTITGSNGMQKLEYRPTGMLELEMADPMPGEYTLEIPALGIGKPVKAKAMVTVTSRPVSVDVDVIRVMSYWSPDKLDFSQKGTELRMYAIVDKGGNPVLDANVTAILTGGSTTTTAVEIQLRDNGIFADAVAGDGIYSAYVIRRYFNGNGRYNAKIRVRGEGEAFVYESKMSGSSAAAVIPGEEEDIDYDAVTLGNFSRQSLPGSVMVKNYKQTSDTTPPSGVTDLHVDDIRYHTDSTGQSIVYTLSWTAVGDDMDVGRAEGYDLRMHEDIDILRESFDSASREISTPQPSIAGERENLSVKFYKQHCNGTCYIGLRVKDGGLFSELSNIVTADVNILYKSEEEPGVNETGMENNEIGENGTWVNGNWVSGTLDNENENKGTGNNQKWDNMITVNETTNNNGTGDNMAGDNGTDDKRTGDNGITDNGTMDNGTRHNGTGTGNTDTGNSGTANNIPGNNWTNNGNNETGKENNGSEIENHGTSIGNSGTGFGTKIGTGNGAKCAFLSHVMVVMTLLCIVQ